MRWLIALALVACVSAYPEPRINYHGHKIIRIIPKNLEELNILRNFHKYHQELDFWKEPSFVDNPVDIRISPEQIGILENLNLSYEVFIEDLQRLITKERAEISRRKSSGIDWANYYELDEIYSWLDQLVEDNPKQVSSIVAAKTYEGRELKGVKISYGSKKPAVFIEAGIHAREWIGPAVATYLIDLILTSQDKTIRNLVESYNWYVIPVFNPDGYAYTHNKDRMWRKTRSPNLLCVGTDPNRNFPYHWMNGGASSNPCSETYGGSSAASEIEIKGSTEFLTNHSDEIEIYISIHSYSQLLMFSYGDSYTHIPDYNTLYRVGTNAADALAQRYGTKFEVGNIAETIYIASGSSIDWMKGTFNTTLTYTYELRDTGRYGFLLPANQIIPTAEETTDSLLQMIKDGRDLLRVEKRNKYPDL